MKFKAATLTREVGLDVGRTVFAALNRVEIVWSILSFFLIQQLAYCYLQLRTSYPIPLLVASLTPFILVAIQTLYVLYFPYYFFILFLPLSFRFSVPFRFLFFASFFLASFGLAFPLFLVIIHFAAQFPLFFLFFRFSFFFSFSNFFATAVTTQLGQ